MISIIRNMIQTPTQVVARSFGLPAECPDQRNKDTTGQMGSRETFRTLHDLFEHLAGTISYRDHKTSSGFKLIQQRWRDVRGPGCNDDRVEGSILRPAARAIAATLSRLPVPCDGSAMMGRCDNCLITGIAAMSSVLRV